MSLKECFFQAILHGFYTMLETLLAYVGTNAFTNINMRLSDLSLLCFGAFIATFIRWIYVNFKKIDFDGDGMSDYVEDDDEEEGNDF